MIKAITVTNHLGESLRLGLTNPEDSGFVVKEVDGLGPANADVNFTELATNDGAIDNSARLKKRNIVLKLNYYTTGEWTIEECRLKSYKYFPIKQNVTLEIETDNRTCKTTGRIEKNSPDIFSKSSGCQISILCPNPYFEDIKTNTLTFYGTEPEFEFPFSNESLTDKLIEFGNIYMRTEGNIFYDGDAPTGIIIRIHAIGEAKGIQIFSLNTREVMSLDDEKFKAIAGSYIKAGDEITINTCKGNKSITLLREGVEYNIINVLGRPISWFQISKGDNPFAYTTSEGLSYLQFRIENNILYEGV